MSATLAGAYSATGAAWQKGPGRVYDRLAEVLLEFVHIQPGARVLDIGAGTGAATRAAERRGASVVAVDVAFGMLAAQGRSRPPAAVADALALPFATGAFDAAVAAFVLNHLEDPAPGLREAARVVHPGGSLLVAAYAADDSHPVKEATEAAAMSRGWQPEPWYMAVRHHAVPRLATVERARAVVTEAGLPPATVVHVKVPFPYLRPEDQVAWRLGMAQLAPFVANLAPGEQQAMVEDALARLGADPPVLERSIIVITVPVR